MKLPLDHQCDAFCDSEDENHKELRKQIRSRAMVKANFKADQAWAHAREALGILTQIREKIRESEQPALSLKELEVINMALTLVLGELYLRQADTY